MKLTIEEAFVKMVQMHVLENHLFYKSRMRKYCCDAKKPVSSLLTVIL